MIWQKMRLPREVYVLFVILLFHKQRYGPTKAENHTSQRCFQNLEIRVSAQVEHNLQAMMQAFRLQYYSSFLRNFRILYSFLLILNKP